jgi:hypothetical protein
LIREITMETTLNPAKLTTLLPAMELKVGENIERVKTLTKMAPGRAKPNDTTEQLKIIGKIVDTISTFVTEMVKTFEKMRTSETSSKPSGKVEDGAPSKNETSVSPPPGSTVQPRNDSPALTELTATIDDLFTKLNSITKKIDNLSKKVSGLGRKLLKGATGGAGGVLKQGIKLLS